MRKSRISVIALATLAGCDNSPSTYAHLQDKLLAIAIFAGSPCDRTIDGYRQSLPIEDCYRFGPPKRMRGIVNLDFESTTFHPEGSSNAEVFGDKSNYFVVSSKTQGPGKVCSERAISCQVSIDFIGRRTIVEGHYGHLGYSDHIVIADRILSAKEIDLTPAPPPTPRLPPPPP